MTCEYDVKEEGRHFWQVQERAGLAMAEDQSKDNPDVYLVDSPRVAAGMEECIPHACCDNFLVFFVYETTYACLKVCSHLI